MDGIWILVSTPHLGPQVNPEDATPNDENSLERAIGSNVNPPPFGTQRKHMHSALVFESSRVKSWQENQDNH